MLKLRRVLGAIGPHRDGERQVLDGFFEAALASHRHAQTEVGVVVVWGRVDEMGEICLGLHVLPCGKSGASQRLASVPGRWQLGRTHPREQLDRGSRVSVVEKLTPPPVPVVDVAGR